MSNLSRLMLLAALAMLATAPANADSIKFFSGTTGYGGAFNGLNTVYDSIKNTNTACAGGGAGNCSGNADVHAASNVAISFIGGITADGSGGTGIGAWYDLQPSFGGMGVGPTSGNPSDADGIVGTDVLHIHFNSAVQLTGVATLFDSGHGPFGSVLTASSTFLLSETLAGLSTLSAVQSFITANGGLLNLASAKISTLLKTPMIIRPSMSVA